MRSFFIYHLPGKKVGCTCDLRRRALEYRQEGYEGPIVVLEQFKGTIKQAGDREWWYARHFGYRLGYHYSYSYAQKYA